jgi:hypothetical protein
MPTFKKEAKLAFPVPANAPSNAFYYVYRRITDQNGNPYFETIDEAFVQGTGANAQVVTASPPFCGYHNSYAKFTIQAGSPPVPLTLEDQDYFVMWDATAQQGRAGLASQGLIVGLAQQTVPAVIGVSPATTQPAQGTVVVSIPSSTPLVSPTGWAIADPTCATFTIFDPQLGGGSREVTATNGTTTLQATADEVNGAQSDDGLYAIYAGLEDLYKNIGRVNFLFPAPTLPPPPPAVSIRLFTLNQNGHRVPAGGILQAGTNIVIAFQSGLTIQSASVGGNQMSVETPDSPDGEVTDNLLEQNLLSARVKGLYLTGAPGNYAVTVTGIDPISLTTVTVSQDILVVAPGGGNTGTFTCTAAVPPADLTTGCSLPQVVDVSPANNSTGVPVSVFPVITFNEPVTHIPGNVFLKDPSGNPVPVQLVGVRAPNPQNPNQNPIANPVQTNDVITSLTLEPLNGLGFNLAYTVTLNENAPAGCLDGQGNPDPKSGSTLIVDLNQSPTGPFCLAPYGVGTQPYTFTTFGPQRLGGDTSQVVTTRPIVLGQYAYAGEYLNTVISGLGMFDVSNPVSPTSYPPAVNFIGRAIDIAGQTKSPVTASGGGLVAISAGPAESNSIPANVWLYDVSSPLQPTRVGAVSVTTDTGSGIAVRLFMKDQFLYASTFLQGLQVIDLGQALTEYSQTSASDFGAAVSTAGSGFAMDAITNTISFPLVINGKATGGIATMFDLKADNFATTGGGSQTLVVATGQLPFVMVDPTIGGSQAILYPPSSGGLFNTNPVQPLQMTSSDGSTKSLLCYGQAMDVGTLPVLNSDGTTSNEHIAVVVGNGIVGPAGSVTSCPVAGQTSALPAQPLLAVINISQIYNAGSPLAPQLIGVLPLPTGGTDVTLNGTVALVSTGSNIQLVNLQNPSAPTAAGQITGSFGNWAALTPTGFIVTTSSNNSAGGVQTATEQSVVFTQCPGPILSSVISGAGTPNAVYQFVEPVNCTVNVVPPSTPASNVNVSFVQTSPSISFTNVALTNDVGQVQIPANTKVTGVVMNAQSSATNPKTKAPILGLTQAIPIGPVHIVVDSDNDTIIDPVKDPAVAAAGKKFSFWQADPNSNAGLDRLLDFAPIRIYVNAVPTPAQGTIQLALTSSSGTNVASWVLTSNIGVRDGSSDTVAAANEHLYLTDQTTATNELANLNSNSGTPVTCGVAYSFETSLCQSQALSWSGSTTVGAIELPNLMTGTMYDLLISCSTCAQDTWTLQVVLVSPSGGATVLDQVPVDIRPIQSWMTVYSFRSGGITPKNNVTSALSPWMDIPSSATTLNVLVHGYDTKEASATEDVFPSYFKRLYWAGQQVLLAQNNTQTVGISWYGDVSLANWPDDEFSALENGIPMANFLSAQADAGRKIRIFAHSLGNMVVNTALTRGQYEAKDALSQHAITSYVMNEAAVPAEAFDTSYSGQDTSTILAAQATLYDGYPLDLTWAAQWADMNTLSPLALAQWYLTLNSANYVTQPQPVYYSRWTQTRPAGGIPDKALAGSAPQRGPWLGFYASNPGQVTITNSFSTNDTVLGVIWFAAVDSEEPNLAYNIGGVTIPQPFTPDDETYQFWAQPTHTDGSQELLWGAPCSTPSTCQHSNILRQWGELAYWFPAVSYAVGSQSVGTLTPMNLTSPYDPPNITSPSSTHSYLRLQPYYSVYGAWQSIHGAMK